MPLGTVGGIQIRVDLSTAVIFALIAFGLAAWQFPAVNSHQATLTYALAAVVTTVVFFASLLAHELAHSLVAGIITPSDITRMMDRLSAAIAGASTHRRLFTISTFTSTHQFRLRDSEPRRLEHASAAVDCLAAPGST